MADTYADASLAAGKVGRARSTWGVKPKLRTITFETAAAYAAGEIKRLFQVGAHEIPVQLDVVNDAIAGATDVNLGLYRPNGGVAVDYDALLDGLDINAGTAWASKRDGLAALGVEERGVKTFREIAADVVTTDVIGHVPNDSYDLAMTIDSDVSAVGTITVHLWTIENQ